MANSYTIHHTITDDQAKVVWATVTFDDAYPSGGEAVAASDLGMSKINGCVVGVSKASGHVGVWDQANLKLMAFVSHTDGGVLVEAAAADLNAVFQAVFFGV